MHFYISNIVNEAIKKNSIFLRRDLKQKNKTQKTQNKRFFSSSKDFVHEKFLLFLFNIPLPLFC